MTVANDTSPSVTLLDRAFERKEDAKLPLHAQIYRGLRYAIENFFTDGQRFFTEKELIAHLKVSQVTVRRAIYDLVRDGMLERLVAKGTFVRRRPASEASAPAETTPEFTVAVHVADWDSAFLSSMLRNVLRVCNSRNFKTQVFYSRQSGAVLGQDGETLNRAAVSAAILIATPGELAADLCRFYEAARIPVVAVDAEAPGNEVHFVGTDNQTITRLGLNHLTSLGHERICLLLNEPEQHGNVVQRARFFEDECKKRRLNGWNIVHCGTKFWEDSYQKAYEIMPKVMALQPRPTAIFAFDDPGAWAVLKWCSQNGVNVPGELSVLGFANDRPSAFTHPGLTTIAHPIEELAAAAVDLVSLHPVKRQVRLLTPSLVVRESTGPVMALQPVDTAAGATPHIA
ncbi:MAG TPA: GntR family transcriptional regulator [Rariglobus sp.]